jgi:ABC-type sugar transport system substrate-binding protein
MSNLCFVVSLITEDSDYQREQAAAAKEAANRLNVDVRISYAENDAIKQNQQLFEVIQSPSSGVNAIIVEPAGSTALPQIARAAVDAGLGWVLLNREDASLAQLAPQSKIPVFSVTADQEETGRILGQQLRALVPTGGDVLCIQGPTSNPVSAQRLKGMNETKPENVTLKLLRSPYWTEAAGFQTVTSWLRLSTSQQGDYAAVVGQSDLIALGARRAFQEVTNADLRDRWLRLPFLGVNGLKVGRNAVQSRLLASTVAIPPSTVPAIEMLVQAYRNGHSAPRLTLVRPASHPSLDVLSGASLA